jgi:thymidylate synthase (FAD)
MKGKEKKMRYDLLNFGFVRLVEDWGRGDIGQAEAGIIEAARQSTAGSFRGWDQDAKLLAHLYNNQHNTPFEFAGMVIEVKAPIFVFREWHRHRTQSYNEMSARYTPLPDQNYVPTLARLLLKGGANKQAQSTGQELDQYHAGQWIESLIDLYEQAQRVYQTGLDFGVPKELARLPVPVARFTQMRASACLRNWLAFMTLRCDPHAQKEIQEYAWAVSNIIKARFPQTWKLWHAAFIKDRPDA